MAKIIQLRPNDDKLYGGCPECGSDVFHLLMTEDEQVIGAECFDCRAEYLFEETGISFEIDGGE